MLFVELAMVLRPSGFIFKQWKKRFLLLTAEGSLLVCHDAASPPDQLVLLQSSCEAIVEGKEILDLPKLPSGGCRDCCFALILPQHKYLLLMADTAADCRLHHVGTMNVCTKSCSNT
uniref:PH domain-containing protein n=1 Tax=Seriola dumerili TaxID=41447 RepID=A0A3B4TPP5_SERDU